MAVTPVGAPGTDHGKVVVESIAPVDVPAELNEDPGSFTAEDYLFQAHTQLITDYLAAMQRDGLCTLPSHSRVVRASRSVFALDPRLQSHRTKLPRVQTRRHPAHSQRPSILPCPPFPGRLPRSTHDPQVADPGLRGLAAGRPPFGVLALLSRPTRRQAGGECPLPARGDGPARLSHRHRRARGRGPRSGGAGPPLDLAAAAALLRRMGTHFLAGAPHPRGGARFLSFPRAYLGKAGCCPFCVGANFLFGST